MEKKQFENDSFVLYSPESLRHITRDMEDILRDSLELYKCIFDVDGFRKVQINYFDDIEKFRSFVYEIRNGDKSLPEYATGTFDGGMINVFIKPTIAENTPLFNRKKYIPSHELFHIMYKELIWEKKNMLRIVWFDEGMAQLFSGEYKEKLEDENYESFVDDIIANTKVVPNLNELSHGSKFETEEYSGYKLSLIAVKHIFDELGLDEFKSLLSDTNRIYEYGETVLNNIFDSYNKNKERSK